MILSRLDITGEIDSNTPKIVLEEICKAHSINSIYRITKSKKNKILVSKDYSNNNLRIIAKYVNSECKNWRRSSLLKAFNFLQNIDSFTKSQKRFTFTYGPQTHEDPESLNSCVLYRLCKYYSLSTNFETTCEAGRLICRNDASNAARL